MRSVCGREIYFVYGLAEPTAASPQEVPVRYIGYSSDPERRYRDHLYRARKPPSPSDTDKVAWLRSLVEPPKLILIAAAASLQEAWEIEREVIAQYHEAGWPLVNMAPGGQCVNHSEAVRERLSRANKRRFADPRSHAVLSRAQRRRWENNPAAREKARATTIAQFKDQEKRANHSAGQRARCARPDEAEVRRQRATAQFADPQARAVAREKAIAQWERIKADPDKYEQARAHLRRAGRRRRELEAARASHQR